MATNENAEFPLAGGCTCGHVRYAMHRSPMIVHCCHCTWCQRETGTAFALNALIESKEIVVDRGRPEIVDTPSASGGGQRIARCPACRVALWSHYSAAGDAVSFLRVGTLDEASAISPDIHIFTSTKQPWVDLASERAVVPDYYRRSNYWPSASIARYDEALGRE